MFYQIYPAHIEHHTQTMTLFEFVSVYSSEGREDCSRAFTTSRQSVPHDAGRSLVPRPGQHHLLDKDWDRLGSSSTADHLQWLDELDSALAVKCFTLAPPA